MEYKVGDKVNLVEIIFSDFDSSGTIMARKITTACEEYYVDFNHNKTLGCEFCPPNGWYKKMDISIVDEN